MKMIYQWGAIKYKVDAQTAGLEVERIASIKPLTAEAIVEESESIDSPLNPIFEWDNEKASHEWRKQQARVMLANLVTVQIGITPIEATRAYVNVTRSDGEYTGIDVVVKSTTLSERLIQQAISELNAYRKKYANVLELKRHFGWLNEFENEVLKEVEK